MLWYYLLYINKAKGLIITSLEKLIQQIEHILEKQEQLIKENKKLKIRLTQLKEHELKIKELETINQKYEDSMKTLTIRLEKLLTL